MPVVIFSKRTNKYLKRHSGSFRRIKGMLIYKKGIKEKIMDMFGPMPICSTDKNRAEYYHNVSQFAEDNLFNADPGNARVYASSGSALTSVGVLRKDYRTSGKVYELPDHLEIHEVKKSTVCVIRTDGSSNCDEEKQ